MENKMIKVRIRGTNPVYIDGKKYHPKEETIVDESLIDRSRSYIEVLEEPKQEIVKEKPKKDKKQYTKREDI